MAVSDPPHSASASSSRKRFPGMTRIERQDFRFALFMVIPAFVAVIAVMGYPWAYSAWLSLHNMNLMTQRWTWVGLDNYQKIFENQSFIDSLVRTLWFSGLVVAGGTILRRLYRARPERIVQGARPHAQHRVTALGNCSSCGWQDFHTHL